MATRVKAINSTVTKDLEPRTSSLDACRADPNVICKKDGHPPPQLEVGTYSPVHANAVRGGNEHALVEQRLDARPLALIARAPEAVGNGFHRGRPALVVAPRPPHGGEDARVQLLVGEGLAARLSIILILVTLANVILFREEERNNVGARRRIPVRALIRREHDRDPLHEFALVLVFEPVSDISGN